MKIVTCNRCGTQYNQKENYKCPNCNSMVIVDKYRNLKFSATLISLFAILILTILGGVNLLNILNISENSVITNQNNLSNESSFKTDNSSQTAVSSQTNSSTNKEKVESSKKDKFESSKLADKNIGNIISGTVNLTIPVEFLELSSEPFDYKLTKENKANGFTSIKKNSDGSATYTIKEKEYKKFINNLKSETKKAIDELILDDTLSTVKTIKYNDNLSEIIITVEKENYENSFESLIETSCGLTACLYQMYDIDAPRNCLIKVKDEATGEIFKTKTFPEK